MPHQKIRDIWQEEFNSKHSSYKIKGFLLEDALSCTYELEDGRELRISVSTQMYHFSKILMKKSYKHVAKIYDCFRLDLKNQYDEMDVAFCVVSERLDRNFASHQDIQSGINLFRNIWSEYLKCQRSLLSNPYVKIEQSYADKDTEGMKYVVNGINETTTKDCIKEIALAIHDAHKRIKNLDENSSLYMFTDNIGLSKDGYIKVCNIGHDFVGLNSNYEINYTPNSVTIKYNPLATEDYILDRRMLIPLKVDFGDGKLLPVLGQIDTGATSSGFTEKFFKRASLKNLGETTVQGATGEMNSYLTQCHVIFPNGYKTELYGATMKDTADISILIGMDLLSRCKLQSEPYSGGFRYRIIFI